MAIGPDGWETDPAAEGWMVSQTRLIPFQGDEACSVVIACVQGIIEGKIQNELDEAHIKALMRVSERMAKEMGFTHDQFLDFLAHMGQPSDSVYQWMNWRNEDDGSE